MTTKTPKELVDRFEILWRDWAASKSPTKLDEILDLFEPNAVIIDGKNRYLGRSEIIEYFDKHCPRAPHFKSSILHEVPIDSNVLLHISWTQTHPSEKRGLSVVNIKRRGDNWKYLSSSEFDG